MLDPIDNMTRTGLAATEHRPRLTRLLQGEDGLEISLLGDTLPESLIEINARLRSGQREQARLHFDDQVMHTIQACIAQDPGCTDVMYVAARLLLETGQPEAAERFLRLILETEDHPVVLADLARLVQRDAARGSEARAYWQRAWELDPNNLEYLLAYASSERDMGDVAGSIALLERAATLAPQHCSVESQLLWSINYVPGYERADFYARAKQWAKHHLSKVPQFHSYDNEPSPTRKLRIGLMAGDFLANSPLTFYAPALASINREAFALYAYSNVSMPDAGTDPYVTLFDRFRTVHGTSDQETADRIRQDCIDILITFGGRCGGNRLGVMALKPAPVQVDCGALSTLGFPQIDYRITDAILDPPEVQPYHTEELVYLPDGFITYQPPATSPPVGPLPAQANGYVTFGSFNNHLKINDFILDLWAQILRNLPRAKLVFKFPGAHHREVRESLLHRLNTRGVDASRIGICGPTGYDDHLCLMGQVDLLLDCYPFNGCRTALEGLWMGVPTMTLSGTTYVSRTGLAILRQLGLDQAFAAQSAQAYIDRACDCARQLEALARIRSGLRDMLLSSSMCDPAGYARSLEGAFGYMWRQWCEKQRMEGSG